MPFQARREQRTIPGGGTLEVILLQDSSGAARVEVCPALGFSCFSWQVQKDGRTVALIHAEPDFVEGKHNTRSGCPILCPFPNRIRNGQFSWDGQNFSIPRNDGPKINAIHGFVCQRAWHMTDQQATGESAQVQAQFQGSVQAPETMAWWPADYFIEARWSLSRSALRLDLTVRNPSDKVLPFGVGAHPYFCLDADDTVQVYARKQWELKDMLPTGEVVPVTPPCDLNQPRAYRELHLDDVLTDIPEARETGTPDSLRVLGHWTNSGLRMRLSASPAFREAVVFTPANRQAFCLEPYTCTTDAINLQQRGVDAGLLRLQPGEQWQGAILVEVEAP